MWASGSWVKAGESLEMSERNGLRSGGSKIRVFFELSGSAGGMQGRMCCLCELVWSFSA